MMGGITITKRYLAGTDLDYDALIDPNSDLFTGVLSQSIKVKNFKHNKL